ncbi:glycosyltransferase family 39 protein [Phycicoccus sp. Soil748]|uniref:ArnT family glycosyltransferase n=1 Tax=Phycicoccus sp. Soil748 TaxID=1736397 RepID=UPI0009EC77A7|nr:glycosyltransferase family 39 protein [Phycicoccus sp. Soil748]
MSTEVPAHSRVASTAGDSAREGSQPAAGTHPDREVTATAAEPGSHWLSGRPFRRTHLLEAAVIGLAVIALAYVYRSIVVPTDPWHYVRSAMYFPSDGWVALGYTRYGMVLANLPTVWLFGNAQATYYFWPILSSGLMAAGVYLIGRRFWGPVAGLAAVALLISNRVIFYNLSRGYPDIMSMALFVGAILCALAARDQQANSRRAWPWLLATGFLLGWGFEVRETSMLVWPLIAVILVQRRHLLRTIALVVLPIVGWAALDVLISWVAYEDPLLKFHVLTGLDVSLAETATGEVKNAAILNQPRSFYVTYIPDRALQSEGGLWMVLMGALTLVGLFVRNHAVRLMSLWFLLAYGLTVLAGGALDPAHPRGLLHVERYWIPFVPAMALASAGLVAVTVQWVARHSPLRRASRILGAALGTALAAVLCFGPVAFAVQYASANPAFAPAGGAALEELRSELDRRDFQGGRIFSDWETVRIFEAYQRPFFGGAKEYPGEARSITGGPQPQPGDYVVLWQKNSKTCGFCSNALKPWTAKHPDGPPSSWKVDYTTSHGILTLYKVQ